MSASLCATFSPNVASLELEGGGGKIVDLMVLLRNLPQMSKIALFPNKLAQVAPHEVFVPGIPFTCITVRINIWCLCEKVFGGHHFLG